SPPPPTARWLAVLPARPANAYSPLVSGTAGGGSTVKLYTNSSCTSAVAASGSAATFSAPGLAPSVPDDSTTTFYATATDTAGNVSGCSTGITYVEDSTPPAAPSLLAVAPASPANDNAPKVSGTAEAGSTVKLYTNGTCTSALAATGTAAAFASPEVGVSATGTTSWSYAFPASRFPVDGSYVVHARALDTAGNVQSFSTTTFTYDGTAPTGSITAPGAAWVHGSSVAVSSDSADGGSGVQQAAFEVSPAGGGNWSSIGTDSSSPYSVTWDTTGLANGSYDLRVVTTDRAGNSTTSATATVGVDNAAPTSALTFVPVSRPDLQYWNASSQTYYYNPAATGDVTVSDAPADSGGSGVASVDFPALSAVGFAGSASSVNGSPYVSGAYAFTSANTTAPSLTVTVVDGAGNQVTETPSFVRDTSAPTNMSASVSAGWTTTTSVPVTLDPGTDSGAGVDATSGIVE